MEKSGKKKAEPQSGAGHPVGPDVLGMQSDPCLEFRGGRFMALVPLLGFLFFCILYLTVLHSYEMSSLVMGAFVSFLIGSVLAKPKHRSNFWEAVFEGMRSAIPILVIQMVIGMFAALMKACDISTGFVWLAQITGVEGNAFTAFTFLATCIIATATGSSLGTIFICFPLFYPSGVTLGADPALIAGAIVCGGIFGDHIAPVSDTTIVSASTQHYRASGKSCDIGGCVATRAKYAITAAAISFCLYLFIGDGSSLAGSSEGLESIGEGNAISLVMLIPVCIMLAVAIKTRDMLMATTVGLVIGTIVSLATGVVTPSEILSVSDGNPEGFLTDGISSMMPVAVLTVSIYGITGVLSASGLLGELTDRICNSRICSTPRGTETAIMLGISITTLAFCGITTAAIALFGTVEDDIGKRTGLHPYRRANLLDGFANGIVLVVPFLSALVLIAASLTTGYAGVPELAPMQISGGMFYCYLIFAVLMVSVITGWGRIFEEPDEKEHTGDKDTEEAPGN